MIQTHDMVDNQLLAFQIIYVQLHQFIQQYYAHNKEVINIIQLSQKPTHDWVEMKYAKYMTHLAKTIEDKMLKGRILFE